MPAGRPKKEIDYVLVSKLSKIFCTQEEIAVILDVSASKLQHDKKFLQVFKRGRETAKSSLRRTQFAQAKKYYAMAIWLGKQYLGQREPREIEVPTDLKDELKEFATAMMNRDKENNGNKPK